MKAFLAAVLSLTPLTVLAEEYSETNDYEAEQAAIESSVNVADELADESLRDLLAAAQSANLDLADRKPAVLGPAREELQEELEIED